MLKDRKNIIILILSIIIFIMVIGIIVFLSINSATKERKLDRSKMSSSELLEMFENEGYEIKMSNIDGTLYINLENERDGITIQRIPDTLIGTLMTFDDDSINDEMADLITISENDSKEKQEQYEAYKSWMEYYNITKTQLSEMLDMYYNNNKDKIETINTEDLLKSLN